jgi:hypothetical protein
MAQQVLTSKEDWNNWFYGAKGTYFEPHIIKPTSFPYVVVWNTEHNKMISFTDYVYPFAEINNEERHTLKRLHPLARFGGGDKIEYIEFCDGEEYQKYLVNATHIALRLTGIK